MVQLIKNIPSNKNSLDLKRRKNTFVKAVNDIGSGKIDEEQIRQSVMKKQAESIMMGIYLLNSGVYSNYIDGVLSKEEDIIIALKDNGAISDDVLKKLEIRSEKQAKRLKKYDAEIERQIQYSTTNLTRLFEESGIDSESLGVSKYLWTNVMPYMLNENNLPPFVTLKEFINITATNLLIYDRYGTKETDSASPVGNNGKFRDYLKTLCENEVRRIDTKASIRSAEKDARILSEILEYSKEGYLDSDLLRRMVLARKINQLENMAESFIEKKTGTDWSKLLVSDGAGNGTPLEPLEKFRILAGTMLELPAAIGTIRKSESELLKDAIHASLEKYKSIAGTDKDTPFSKKEAQYHSDMLAKFEGGALSVDDIKGIMQSQKAEKLYSIAGYFFEKTKSAQYFAGNHHEKIDAGALDKNEIFLKMLSNANEMLLLLNERDSKVGKALEEVLVYAHHQKMRESNQSVKEAGNGKNGNDSDELHELISRKKELAAIEAARDAISRSWNVIETEKKDVLHRQKTSYAVEKKADAHLDGISFYELSRYIIGRKSEEVRSMTEGISRKNKRIEEVLDALDLGGYNDIVAEKYLESIKKLGSAKNSEHLDALIDDLIDRIENEDAELKNDIVYANLKNIRSANGNPGKRKELEEKLGSIIENIEESTYGSVKYSFFKKIEELKLVSEPDDFIEKSYALVTEFEDTYPELIFDPIYSDLTALASEAPALIRCEQKDRELIGKINKILDNYNDGNDAIPEGKEKILDALYGRIKLFALHDDKTVKSIVQKNIPEMSRTFLSESEDNVKKELSKLLAYQETSETDLIYAAKKLCDYRIDFLGKKIAGLDAKVKSKAKELLGYASEYITETQDYFGLVQKPVNGAISRDDVSESVADAAYDFARDYSVHNILLDLFTKEKTHI